MARHLHTLGREENSMSIPTEITFHEIDASESAEAAIERWVARLEHIHDRIVHVQTTVALPHRHQRHQEFEVLVKVDIAGSQIVRHGRNEDVYVAIADAFRGARRRLMDHRPVFARDRVTTHAPTG
jgi:ribosomal subunit interface protein